MTDQYLIKHKQRAGEIFPESEDYPTSTLNQAARDGYMAAVEDLRPIKQEERESADQVAKDLSEKAFPYSDFQSIHKNSPEGEHTGQALRGAYCEGFENGVQYAFQSEPNQRMYTEEEISRVKSELKRIEQFSDVGDDFKAVFEIKSIATDILQSLNK